MQFVLWDGGNHKVLRTVKPSTQNVTSEVLLPILMFADIPLGQTSLAMPHLRQPQTLPARSLAHTLVLSSTRLKKRI